jgi:pyruvate dehydrogenase E2 component (dihydrolipoamide acetyltransferase)
MSTIPVTVQGLGGAIAMLRELRVREGDTVAAEQVLAVIETEKAQLDVPAPCSGVVRKLCLSLKADLDENTALMELEPTSPVETQPTPNELAPLASEPAAGEVAAEPPRVDAEPSPSTSAAGSVPYAGPSVRRVARYWGIDLALVSGTGKRQRIAHEDLRRYARAVFSGQLRPSGHAPTAAAASKPTSHDFARFGEVELRPLSRIRLVSGARLTANAASIPHVTQFDAADITELEQIRGSLNQPGSERLTLLPFVIKACVSALLTFPEVNASLAGDELVLKRYVNVGFAVETPQGLLVPVIHGADRLPIRAIGRRVSELVAKARAGELTLDEQRGGCFTVSSLGGVGGKAFTPIINAPELAILGVSRHAYEPRWNGASFEPRLILPLSLSYDHRAIDGAQGARFLGHIADVLRDLRQALL